MGVLTENPRTGEHILSEAPGTRSREQIIIAQSAALKATTILGAIPGGTAASAAKAGGNTGNGTFVLDGTTPVLPRAKHGVYPLRCIAAAANGGTFRLEDPDGIVLGDFVVAGGAGGTVTVAEHIKGVLTDGGTDFVVGDGFDITVSAITTKYKQLAPAATDGTQIACGILYAAVDATDGDAPGVAHVRDFEANAHLLTWPAGITTAQKAKATADLKRAGIILRS